MVLYLGIDGGGSGCRAALADASGQVLGRGAAGPANIASDPDGARASILAAAAAALARAGGGDPAEIRAVLGLAGANVGPEAARLEAGLPWGRVRVTGDAVTATRGALGRDDGAVAVLGTGAIFAAQRGGRVRTVGGWGFRLGDQGGGAWIGRALYEEALLAHDGLRPATPLLTAVLEEAGGPEALVLWAAPATPADFARAVPRLVAAAEAGDPAATAILAEATAAVTAGIDALGTGPSLPLCLLGGLGPVFAARLPERLRARLHPPAGTALDGALALARELS